MEANGWIVMEFNFRKLQQSAVTNSNEQNDFTIQPLKSTKLAIIVISGRVYEADT